jgi:hypothetical protein
MLKQGFFKQVIDSVQAIYIRLNASGHDYPPFKAMLSFLRGLGNNRAVLYIPGSAARGYILKYQMTEVTYVTENFGEDSVCVL